MKGCGGMYNTAIYDCDNEEELRVFWCDHSKEKWTKTTIKSFVLHLRFLEPSLTATGPKMGGTVADIAAWAQQ